jgi:nickel transport protein
MYEPERNHPVRQCCLLGVIACCLALIPAGSVWAHKFLVTAWVEGNRVYVESAFGDGSLPDGAEVVVYDDTGQRLLNGRTDAGGGFSFTIPRKTALTVVVNAGMGHQAEEVIPVEDLPGEPVSGATGQAEAVAGPEGEQAAAVVGLTAAELQTVIEEALDNKLRPIVRKLAAKEEPGSPPLHDILGGIGYIVGLVGAGAYFHYRRKQG